MIGTAIRPNHLTTLRLACGLGAAAVLAIGSHAAMLWGGGLWLASAFLDRADGELARLGKLSSHAGHVYDFYSDFAVNTALFVGIGIGLRHSWLGRWAIPLGLLTGATLLTASVCAERIERRRPGTAAYGGRWGFHPDDAMYLMTPAAWFGWLAPILVGAALGSSLFAVLTGARLYRLAGTAGPAASHRTHRT